MLEIRDLSVGYGGKDVVKHVNLEIPEGKVTVILGPNGCGKTTLLKAICGILDVSGGKVLLDGQFVLELPRREAAQKIAYLAQNRQIPDITAERLVLHGRFPYLSYPRRYRKEDLRIAREAMERMEVSDLAEMPLNKLSGGQRQKVYIAMALAQDTPVILLDEPTTYLDVGHQLQMMRQARELADMGKTVIMILHDLSGALQTADRIVLMKDGETAAIGTPEEVFSSGKMDEVFGVKVKRVRTERGWQYYCE